VNIVSDSIRLPRSSKIAARGIATRRPSSSAAHAGFHALSSGTNCSSVYRNVFPVSVGSY